MPNYALSINSTFQPLSFERYIQPYQIYGEEYRRQEEALNELEMKASIWEGLANKQVDKAAYAQYKQYADALREQAGLIAQNGLSMGSRRALNELKRRYVSEILPIEQAYTRRAEQQKAQREILLKDPTRIFNNMASQQSLDYYMNNPTYDATEQQVSGALISSMVSQAGKRIAEELSTYGLQNLPNDSYTNIFTQKYGLSAKQVSDYLKNPKDPNNAAVLSALVDSAIGTTDVPKWGNQDALDRLTSYANMGLWDTIGKETVTPMEDFGSREALKHQYREQEADSALQRSIILSDHQTENEIRKIQARYGNPSAGDTYYGADNIDFDENGQMVIIDPTTGEAVPLGGIDVSSSANGGGSGSGGKKSGSKSSGGSGGGSGVIGTLPFNTSDFASPNFGSRDYQKKVNRMYENLGGNTSNKLGIKDGYVNVPMTVTYQTTMGQRTSEMSRRFKLWGNGSNGKPSYIMSQKEFVSQGGTEAQKQALRKYYKEKVIPARQFFGLVSTDGPRVNNGRVNNAESKMNKVYNLRWNESGTTSMNLIPLEMDEGSRKEALGHMISMTSPKRDSRGDIREVTSWDKAGNITFGDRVPASDIMNDDGSLVDSNVRLFDRGVPGSGGSNDAYNYIFVQSGGKYYAFPKAKLGTIMNTSMNTGVELAKHNNDLTVEVEKLARKIRANNPSLKFDQSKQIASDILLQLNPGITATTDNLGAAYLRELLQGIGYKYEVDKSKVTTTTVNSQQ